MIGAIVRFEAQTTGGTYEAEGRIVDKHTDQGKSYYMIVDEEGEAHTVRCSAVKGVIKMNA